MSQTTAGVETVPREKVLSSLLLLPTLRHRRTERRKRAERDKLPALRYGEPLLVRAVDASPLSVDPTNDALRGTPDAEQSVAFLIRPLSGRDGPLRYGDWVRIGLAADPAAAVRAENSDERVVRVVRGGPTSGTDFCLVDPARSESPGAFLRPGSPVAWVDHEGRRWRYAADHEGEVTITKKFLKTWGTFTLERVEDPVPR